MARKDSPSSSPTNAHDSTPDSSPTSAPSPGMAASTAQMRSEAPSSAVGQVMAGGAATSEAPLVIVRPGANASVPAGNGSEYFSCGSMVRCVTCHDVTIEGHVMAFDPQTRVLAISKYPMSYTYDMIVVKVCCGSIGTGCFPGYDFSIKAPLGIMLPSGSKINICPFWSLIN